MVSAKTIMGVHRFAAAASCALIAAVLFGVFSGPERVGRVMADTCVLSQGYWSEHPAAWPVASLTLGNPSNPAHTYTKTELLKILGSSPKGDASLILATQEIAAKLNIARGSNVAPVAVTLASADDLLGAFAGKLPYKAAPSGPAGAAMVAAASRLEQYNLGNLPQSCGSRNTAPVANAGPDQTVPLAAVVTLNGSASSDADGDALTFTWSFVSKPASSGATLSDIHAVLPTFVADAVGTYDVQLVVDDGIAASSPDVVRISTQNSRPVANAGHDQSLAVTSVVQLDGSASVDPDGDSLTFSWSFNSVPSGSAAALSNPSAIAPTFTIDRPGNYIVQLIVSDGRLSSAPAAVTISTVNSSPHADAGPDQTAAVTALVTLNGTHSSDVDGDPLTFAWSFTSKPAESQASLDSPTSVSPSFVVDAPGVYVAQLVVNDGNVNSAPDTVSITTTNSPPTAKAGPDQTVFVGANVQLDGSGSTDVDGNALTFTWALTTRPDGSAAALSNAAAVTPTFVADLPGDYVAQLIVNDGTLDSAPDTVAITTLVQNHPPSADPGGDRTVAVGATVELDGSGSSDPDGDALAFKWSLLSIPAGSAAALSSTTIVNPTMIADAAGSYVVQLIVNDGQADSSPRTVTISTANSAPTAIAGPSQTVAPNTTVQLDGRASFDPDGTPLTYAWSLLSAPPGSGAALSNATTANPGFVADLEGVYVAQLIVSDGVLFSGPATVTVTAQNPADLEAGFENPPVNPAVGSTVSFFVRIRNLGPGATNNVTADFKLPAGYTLVDARPFAVTGTYDPASGIWTIDSLPCCAGFLSVTATVNPNGPYDLTVSITHSPAPDPNPGNNSATVNVSPNPNADLDISFFNAPTNPAVGSDVDFFVTIKNLGPSSANDVTAQFALPSGYTSRGIRTGIGTYDPTTGIWTIGSLQCCPSFDIAVSATVNASGPYDLTAAVTHSSAPDPNPLNNSVTASVSPNRNADLSITFFNAPAGFHMPGTDVDFFLIVQNLGPSSASGVSAHFPLPAGYSLFRGGVPSQGSYDPATGDWTIGVIPGAQQASIGFSARVNPVGPAALVATITGSNEPDPNVANNIAAPPPINRPPIPTVGPDQTAPTNTPVALDGTQSFDPDGDPFTYQWTFALRPLNSQATFTGPATATPSFVPDRGGRYIAQLSLVDSHGIVSVAPAKVTIVADELNHAPVIRSTPITTAAVGQPYSYPVIAADPDAGDLLTFSLVAPPAGMTIDAATGLMAWTPSAAQAGMQAVSIRVQDAAGLFAVQTFAVQVSSDSEHAPIATDDSYQVHVSESLGVRAPGVLANDTDAESHPLAVRLLTPPVNGSVSLGGDGSFTYTPFELQAGEFVFAENVNLSTRLPGVTFNAGSFSFNFETYRAFDDNPATEWLTPFGTSFIEVAFPQDVTASRVELLGIRDTGGDALLGVTTAGIVQLFDVDGNELYTSGNVELPAPAHDGVFLIPDIAHVRRARFTPTDSDSAGSHFGIAEFKVIGSTLIRRQRRLEPNLMQLLPVAIQASSVNAFNIPEAIADDALNTNWYAASLNPGEFIEATFPVDVTVTELETLNASGRPDGFGTSQVFNCSGTFTLFDAAGTELFNSGVLPVLRGVPIQQPFSVPVPSLANVRRARVTITDCTGTQLPPGFSEFHVFGAAPVDTPALSMAKKFQVLTGREVHSTTIVANLTDDDGDGRVDANDIPDIVVPVESTTNQRKGEIEVVSGDDGRLLFTAGAPDLVSPWSELAVGDLDGDGIAEIVAVHSDGNHLIAFEHTGAVRWVSDPNPMPAFDFGGSPLFGGAVAIANLDGAGRPEIIVGASVFDADGHLLGDGRALGGTTAGTGLRSAMSAIADVDLDGVPELVAGPTTYRLSNGQLTKVWQRSDRNDGLVAIANFDDDPQAEIVVVAKGFVYMLNHDGSDAEVWSAPSHEPVAIPGGGDGGSPLVVDVDGDGVPEIGVAAQTRYTVFNRDGSMRWTSAIMDRSSFSTGSVAFDLDGDGQVEIIYRDQNFLRVFRGSDGVLLAKTPVGSATWAEEPVVADVDNDGHADIVVSSDFQNQPTGRTDTGVIVLQDVANKWTRTRRIWNQHGYHVTNVNEDGTIPLVETPHWLAPGLNAFRTNLFVPGETPDGTDSFTYIASDGTLDSNVATVRIAVRAPNGPPSFTSRPAAHAAGNVAYLYAAQASDPDAGDILTFTLPTAPAGMTIDSSTGLIRWTPTDGQLGAHDVVVKVRDVRGLSALQNYTVTVGAAIAVPDVVGRSQANAEAAIAVVNLTVGAVTQRHSPTVPSGSVLSQNPAAGALVASATLVNLVVSSGPAPSGTVPDVLGQPQTSALADIAAAGFSVGAVAGQNDATVPSGIVLSQNPAGGSQAQSGTPVSLVVSLGPFPGDVDQDGDGFSPNLGDCNDGNAAIHPGAFDMPGDGIDQDCNGRDSIAGDDTPPTASIALPADLATITMPIEIVGTATDANLLRYTLTLAEVDAATAVTIAAGTSAVANAVLGRIDPTLLENGLYRVRLVVEDVNGQTAVAERVYRVDGMAKVGEFRISFVDLSVPVAGIPIAVMRTFDSNVKSQEDFGIGWTLDVARGFYRHNRTPGRGWIVRDQPFLGGSLPCIGGSLETLSHLTEVRLSDRESYTFALQISNGNVGVTGACEATASFRFVDGTQKGASLDILDGTGVIYLRGGEDSLLDMAAFLEGTNRVYDPQRVRLTTIDGTKIDLERHGGIARIEDRNGNAMSITANGIVHSSGKSIGFLRDAKNRITRITDPLGNHLDYAYDAAGDLVEFVDGAANQTRFVYDSRHNLQEIVDPLGNRAGRAEYDADGRLVAIVDATGNRITMSHDIASHREVLTDRLGQTTIVEYDDRGNVLRRTDALGHTTQYTFDARDNLLTQTDSLGHARSYAYDANDNKIADTDPVGNVTTFTYNAFREETTRTDPRGGVTTRSYDAKGNLLSERDPMGGVTRYAYDGRGQMTSLTNPSGATRTFAYDGAGREISETDPLGNVTSRAYDAAGHLVAEAATRLVNGELRPLTNRYVYDERGLMIESIDAENAVTSTTYAPSGRPTSRTDALGRVTSYRYDEQGRRTQIERPDGLVEQFEYDAEGRRVKIVDAAGHEETTVFDAVGRPVTTRHADGTARSVTYDAAGRVVSTIDEEGRTTTIEYDAADRQLSTTNALGETTQIAYDGNGNIVAQRDASQRLTAFSFDLANRLIRTAHSSGQTEGGSDEIAVSQTFDAAGRLVTRTNEEGDVTQYEYNARGDLTAVVDPLGHRTAYEYDAVGNRLAVTDAAGRTTRYSYDGVRRLVTATLPLGQTSTRAYDSAGNLVSAADFNGDTTVYAYDAMNRITRRTVPSSAEVHSYAYTPTGRLAAMTDSHGTTTFDYDERDRPLAVHQPDGRGIRYGYDAVGNRIGLSTPEGDTALTYDSANRLSGVQDPAGNQITVVYNVSGRPARVQYPGDLTTDFSYDSLDRLINVAHRKNGTTVAEYAYVLGGRGERLQVRESSGRQVDYAYDADGRLTQESVTSGGATATTAYTYDAVGNRLTRTTPAGLLLYGYDANHRLTTAGAVSFAYDANGNLATRTVGGASTSYAYDVFGRLRQISEPGGAVTQYAYDALDQRVQRVTPAGTSNYLVDPAHPSGLSQVLMETDAFGQTIASYLQAGTTPLGQRSNGQTSFLLADGPNSTRLIADASGTITDSFDYDAFGNLERRTGATRAPYAFNGQEFDPASGFYFLRARQYDAQTGRFTSRDPFAGSDNSPVTLHPYLYAENDPVNRADPSGETTLAEAMFVTNIVFTLATTAYDLYQGNYKSAAFGVALAVVPFGSIFKGVSRAARLLEPVIPKLLTGGSTIKSLGPAAATQVFAFADEGVQVIANLAPDAATITGTIGGEIEAAAQTLPEAVSTLSEVSRAIKSGGSVEAVHLLMSADKSALRTIYDGLRGIYTQGVRSSEELVPYLRKTVGETGWQAKLCAIASAHYVFTGQFTDGSTFATMVEVAAQTVLRGSGYRCSPVGVAQ